MAKHRACAPEPLNLIVQETALDARAHDTGSRFRTQCEALTITVGEGVHLLRHDVCVLPDRACKKLRLLKQRNTDLPVTVGLENTTRRRFNPLPRGSLIGQQVIHSPNGLYQFAHGANLGRLKLGMHTLATRQAEIAP